MPHCYGPAMDKNPFCADWLQLTFAASYLWTESAMVVWMRVMLFATQHPDTREEATRMISEKFAHNLDLAAKLAIGRPRSASQAALFSLDHYSRVVRANRKRLSKGQ